MVILKFKETQRPLQVSVDLKDVYFSIQMWSEHHDYLTFS